MREWPRFDLSTGPRRSQTCKEFRAAKSKAKNSRFSVRFRAVKMGIFSVLALIGLVGLSMPTRAAVPCSSHLLKGQVRLQEIFHKMDGHQKEVFESAADRAVEWRRLGFLLAEALASSGLKVSPLEDGNFRILPEGEAPIAKWAKQLQEWSGIDLIVSPDYWYSYGSLSALGGFHRHLRIYFIDQASLVQGRMSVAGLHEAQHALNFHLSLKDRYLYERILQSGFSAASKADGVLPGIAVHRYENYFSLDEISAHRKSAEALLRRRHPTAQETLFLKTHFERLSSFISHGQFLAELFQSAVLRNRVEVHRRENGEVVIYLTAHAGPFGFFGGAAGDSLRGTSLELYFSEEELRRKDPRTLVLERLSEMMVELAVLYPLAAELKNAWNQQGDGAHVRALFQRFTNQMEARRRTLNSN